MSLLIAEEILNNELQLLESEHPGNFKMSEVKTSLLKSIYEIAKGEEIRTIVDNNYMTYDEVISNVHMKIGGELLAISMLIFKAHSFGNTQQNCCSIKQNSKLSIYL